MANTRHDITAAHLRDWVTTQDASVRVNIRYRFALEPGQELTADCITMLNAELPKLSPEAAHQVLSQLSDVLPEDWNSAKDQYRTAAFQAEIAKLCDRYGADCAERVDVVNAFCMKNDSGEGKTWANGPRSGGFGTIFGPSVLISEAHALLMLSYTQPGREWTLCVHETPNREITLHGVDPTRDEMTSTLRYTGAPIWMIDVCMVLAAVATRNPT